MESTILARTKVDVEALEKEEFFKEYEEARKERFETIISQIETMAFNLEAELVRHGGALINIDNIRADINIELLQNHVIAVKKDLEDCYETLIWLKEKFKKDCEKEKKRLEELKNKVIKKREFLNFNEYQELSETDRKLMNKFEEVTKKKASYYGKPTQTFLLWKEKYLSDNQDGSGK